MGLSEDQKAMLRLLAQREQGYDDIAALMGLTVEQVRERVKDALKQLDEGSDELRAAGPVAQTGPSDEPRPVGPVTGDDSSSSQAAGEEPSPAPPTGGASVEGIASPKERVQEAPAPSPPSSSSPTPQGSVAAPKQQGSRSQISLPSGQGARAAVAAGVAALVIVVVILVVGGGGDGSSDSTTAANSPAAETGSNGEPTSGNVKELTKAVLDPVGGSEGSGVAIFGRVKNRLALQVEAEGLEPTGDGRSYAIWLAESPQKMLPLASTAAGSNGRIGAQFEVPTEVLGYLANETFDQIVITEANDSQLEASIRKATSEKTAPDYTGTAVLEGQITGPVIGAAKKQG